MNRVGGHVLPIIGVKYVKVERLEREPTIYKTSLGMKT